MEWRMGCPQLGQYSVEAVGWPLPIALFVRQSFGSLDVLLIEGLLWLTDFEVLQHDYRSTPTFVSSWRARINRS
jgi:hypothetical protein